MNILPLPRLALALTWFAVTTLTSACLLAAPAPAQITIHYPEITKEGIIGQPPPWYRPRGGDQAPGESGPGNGGGSGSGGESEDGDGVNTEGQGEDGGDGAGLGAGCTIFTDKIGPEGDPGGGGGPSSPMSFDSISPQPQQPPGLQPEPTSGGFLVEPGGRPPLMHSGQMDHTVVDLSLPGIEPGSSLRIQRRHITRVNDVSSCFGPGWYFNFEHVFVISGSSQLELDLQGFGRVDTFTLDAASPSGSPVWTGGFGRFEVAYLEGGDLIVRRRDGQKLVYDVYETTTGTGAVTRREGRLREVISSSGNAVRVEYSDPDPRTTTIVRLRDAFNRPVDLFREDTAHPDYVTRIRDFAGREVNYAYDAAGNLREVTTPAVTTTGTLANDFPQGKTTKYEYVGGGGILQHALQAVVAPNQASAGLETCLSFEYYGSSHPFHGWLWKRTAGNRESGTPAQLQAGGTWEYSYTLTGQYASDVNTTVLIASVVDAAGTTASYHMNGFGQMLAEHIHPQSPPLRPGASGPWTKTFEYTADGSLQVVTFPGGESETYIYSTPPSGTPLPLQRLLAGDVSRVEFRALSTPATATPDEARQEVVEPIFGRTVLSIGPRGLEPGAAPAEHTTEYTYDYMEDLAASALQFAPQLGVASGDLSNLFQALGMSSQGDANGDGTVAQRCGTLIRVESPAVVLPAQAAGAVPQLTQEAESLFAYNDHGQLIREVDPEGNVTLYSYLGSRDPDGDGVPDQAGGSLTEGGFLESTTMDAEHASGRNSGQNPTPVVRTLTHEYTAQVAGTVTVPPNPRGVPTRIVDSRGVGTVQLVNERDQVVSMWSAAHVPIGSGYTGYAYRKDFLRDANDNIVEIRVEDRDGLDGSGSVIRHLSEYDILNQKTATVQDAGGLGIRKEVTWSPNGDRVKVVKAAHLPPAEQLERTWTFDERHIWITKTLGNDPATQSTLTSEIDAAGNVTKITDAEGGDQTLYGYDAFNRRTATLDRTGTLTLTEYDVAGNVIGRKVRGVVPFLPGLQTLREAEMLYDVHGRLERRDEKLLHYGPFSVGVLDDGGLDPGDGWVSEIFIHDRNDRLVAVVDADGNLTESRYDGLHRVLREIDAAGNEIHYTYDSEGNVRFVLVREHSPLLATSEEFLTESRFDALGRERLRIAPNGQQTGFAYDSRNNLIATTDALGNVRECRYDRLDRQVGERTYLSATGQGASATNKDPLQGGGDGAIDVWTTWDALSRVEIRVDDNGNITEHHYDSLGRRSRTDYGDGTFEEWTYNRDSELFEHTSQQGVVTRFVRDTEGRLLESEVVTVPATAQLLGSTKQSYWYDGLGRTWLHSDRNLGPGTTVHVWCWLDSLGRRIREEVFLGPESSPQPISVVEFEYAARVRRVSEKYPSGRKLRRSHDSLNRVAEIRESDGSLIVRRDFAGALRMIRQVNGNGTVLDKRNQSQTQTIGGGEPGYDANGRPLLFRWRSAAGGPILTSYVNTYNGPGGVGTGRRESETRQHFGRTDSYSFDSGYRVTSVIRDSGSGTPVTSTARLDGSDKFLDYVDQGQDQMPIVDGDPAEAGLNQYSSFGGGVRNYDELGNLISDGTGRSFQFDATGRLTAIWSGAIGASTPIAVYIYDALDRRRAVAANGENRIYTYGADWEVMEERQLGDSSPEREYVTGAGLDDHVQIKDFTETSGAQTYYYHTNSQGWIGALSDATGQPAEYYEYSWLGQPKIWAANGTTPLAQSSVGNPYMFHGRRYDQESGLYHYRNRQYDPRTGEFITVDPAGLWNHGQGNGYSAFGGDPFNNGDPLGLGWFSKFLDLTQTALDFAGMVPGVGNAADLANAGISAARGDLKGAGLSLTAAIPGVGQAAGAANIARRSANAAEEIADTYTDLKRAQRSTDAARQVDSTGAPASPSRSGGGGGGGAGDGNGGRGSGGSNCFMAGTLVHTAAGLMSIEELEPGMIVRSLDPVSFELTWNRVAQIFENEVPETLELSFEFDGSGEREQLVTTPGHPFLTRVGGFVTAEHLEVGTPVRSTLARWSRLVSKRRVPGTAQVYNFEVARTHTYFVGRTGLCVHNDCKKNRDNDGSPGGDEAAKGGGKWTKEVVTRKAPGADGATSRHILEKLDGKTNSVTHQVTKDGKVIHQHQTHIGTNGGQRQFPDEWVEFPEIPGGGQ